MRTPTQGKAHGVHAIAGQASGNAKRQTQLALLERAHHVANAESSKKVGAADNAADLEE